MNNLIRKLVYHIYIMDSSSSRDDSKMDSLTKTIDKKENPSKSPGTGTTPLSWFAPLDRAKCVSITFQTIQVTASSESEKGS